MAGDNNSSQHSASSQLPSGGSSAGPSQGEPSRPPLRAPSDLSEASLDLGDMLDAGIGVEEGDGQPPHHFGGAFPAVAGRRKPESMAFTRRTALVRQNATLSE